MQKLGIRRRFAAGVFGQAYTRVAYALSTIALVPILIGAWGLEGYGEWMALTALATYFSYSNFGLVTTSANEIVMAIGAREELRARRTFQMSINVAVYVVLPILLVLLAVAACLPIAKILQLSAVRPSGVMLILALSAVQLWVSTLRGILVAALYATGAYGLAYFETGTMKFVELLAVGGTVLILGGTQVAAAAAIALVGLIDIVIIYALARRAAPWARPDMRVFDTRWLRSQVKPALGFALANLSTQGVIVQGPRVILSAALGPPAVAIYAVYATAMRLIDQLLLMVALPLEIEIAHHVGSNDRARAYSLIVSGTQAGWALFGIVSFGFLIAGNMIFNFWTHDRVEFSLSLMTLFLLMSACNQVGRINAHALIATNRMYGPSIVTLVGCCIFLLLGGFLARHFGIPGMAIGIICAELFYSLVVVRASIAWHGITATKFLRDVLCGINRDRSAQ